MLIREIDNETEFSIKQASEILGVESYLLRYWEEELKIPVARTESGRRVYRKKELLEFQKIIDERNSGIKLRDIKLQYSSNRHFQNTNNELININCTNNHSGNKNSEGEKIEYMISYRNNPQIITHKKSVERKEEDTKKQVSKDCSNKYIREKEASKKAIEYPDVVNNNYISDCEEKERELKINKIEELLSRILIQAMEIGTESIVKEMGENVKEAIAKEMDYQFRLKEEKDMEILEERFLKEEELFQKQEEHFQKVDELLRAGMKMSKKRFMKNKKKIIANEG